MKGFLQLSLIFSVLNFTMGTGFAASLEKYGSPQKYESPAQPVKSRRELKIEQAVENIRQASPENRQKMIAAYKARIRKAEKEKNYNAAGFYQEILDRSGN